MTHCTVCGAPAREGAKFCTSCGARLVDTAYSAPAETDAASEETAVAAAIPVDAVAEDDLPAGEPEATWASPEPAEQPASEALVETEVAPEASAEQELAEAPPAEQEYTASWPAEDETKGVEPANEAGTAPAPLSSWSSWSSEDASPEPAAPEAFATNADQDVRADTAPGTDTDDVAGTADAAIADANEGMEASHHGASDWESWAPVASGESAVAAHANPTGEHVTPAQPARAGDLAASVRRLLDDLANRIDRMIEPATLASRDVDADALADQLERWSRPAQGSTELLEVVQAVRKAPRDLDAIGQLADHAADLELLVRHYQAITAGAGKWARELRGNQTPGTDDA